MARAHATLVPAPLAPAFPRARRGARARPRQAPGRAVRDGGRPGRGGPRASGLVEQAPAFPPLEDTVRDAALTTMLSRSPRPWPRSTGRATRTRRATPCGGRCGSSSGCWGSSASRPGLGERPGQVESDASRQRYATCGNAASTCASGRSGARAVPPFAGRRDATPCRSCRFLLQPRRGAAAERWRSRSYSGCTKPPRTRPTSSCDRSSSGRARPRHAPAGRSFLTEYPLVVAREGRADLWAGCGAHPRAVAVRGVALAEGKPTLCDRDGSPCSRSTRWCRSRPRPRCAEELFLFEGKGARGTARRAAARLRVARPDAVGLVPRPAPEHRQRRRGRVHRGASAVPGLSPFTPGDAGLFFGRERAPRCSSTGSACSPCSPSWGRRGPGRARSWQAGVLPACPRLALRHLPARARAARRAHGLPRPRWPGRGRHGRDRPRALAGTPRPAPTRSAARGAGRDTGAVVDQLEELFTLCGDAGERQVFAEALMRAARSADDRCASCSRCATTSWCAPSSSGAARAARQGLQLLTTPAPEDLTRILVEPARRSGYKFEDEKLPAEMVAEVADQPSALALLSFTAARLWDDRDRHFRLLRRQAYQALGGVGGALASTPRPRWRPCRTSSAPGAGGLSPPRHARGRGRCSRGSTCRG